MTFKEKAIEMMTSGGLAGDEAARIFETIKAAPENKAMAGRWEDQRNGGGVR